MILTDANAKLLEVPEGQKSKVYWDDGLTIFGVRCWQDSPNVWVARDGLGGYHKLAPVEALPCREAKELAISRVREVVLGTSESDPLVHGVLDKWTKMLCGRVAPVTQVDYKRWCRWLKKVIPANARCSQAADHEIVKSWERKIKRMSTAHTTPQIMDYLRRMLSYEGKPWPRGIATTAPRKRRPRVLTWDEWRRLWAALGELEEKDPTERMAKRTLFWRILLTSPLRPWSELLPRRWFDVHKTDHGTYFKLAKRKNDYGANTEMRVFLDPVVVPYLDAINVQSGAIFSGQDWDQPMDKGNLLRTFDKAKKLAKIKGHLIPRDLRHTASTRLEEARVPPKIQEMLAGATSQTLQRTYQHPSIEAAFAAQQSIGYTNHAQEAT